MKLGILEKPDFLLFTAARVIGIGIRPLILFFAATRGFSEFSDAFALFATAVAGSFVVFSNEAHIRLYRAQFNGSTDVLRLYLAVRFFVANSISHVIWFSAIGTALLYFWTDDAWLAGFGLLVLFAEKIYDEFQRYYMYKRAYVQWTIGFAFRYGLPGLAVLTPIGLGWQPTLSLYIAAYVVACVVYLAIWERRSLTFYARLYARDWRGGRILISYIPTYISGLCANQAWVLLAANFYLLDRVMINQTDLSIGAYVLFCNLFNLSVFSHTTLYFVRRRPDLIKEGSSLTRELFRSQNLIPPLVYTLGVLAVCIVLIRYQPVYASFDPTLVVGLAIYFFVQAITLVVHDFVFWRVKREMLVAVDVVLGVMGLGSFMILELPASYIPLLMTVLILARVGAYAMLWRRGYHVQN